LVDEKREAGIHEVKFDASALPSDVYFYRLHAGTYVETKKLLLMNSENLPATSPLAGISYARCRAPK